MEKAFRFTANGYANGWIVKNIKGNVTVKYKIQDLITIGFVISGASFILSALYLLSESRKNE